MLVLRATTQTVYLNDELLPSSTNPSGVTNEFGGIKNEQKIARGSPYRDSRSNNRSCRSRNSSDCYNYRRNQLYGLYDYANGSTIVPVVSSGPRFSRNRGLHDVARIKRCNEDVQEKFSRTIDWDSHSGNRCSRSSYSCCDYDDWLRLHGFGQSPSVRSQHFASCIQLFGQCRDSRQPVPVAGSSVNSSWNRGLYDIARLGSSTYKEAFSPPSFSFFYSPTNQFINEFNLIVEEEN